MTTITLTTDQQNALDQILKFIIDPIETVFVLKGYSGTGKTTLVKTLLAMLPNFLKATKLINPKLQTYDVELTATTNKAAEAFAQITDLPVGTIHAFLGLRVQTDYKTSTSHLVPSKKIPPEGRLLFIDEASYIDKALLGWIFKLTNRCKVILMGDPAQLTPVKSTGTPAFEAKFKEAMLSQVVRQAEGNPIIDLSTRFRETVASGDFFQFTPDGHHIQYMDRDTFNKTLLADFSRPDWKYQDSKFLAWTNKTVIDYNHMISSQVTGDPNFQVGDYAVCNKYVVAGKRNIKTDQLVCITGIDPGIFQHGVQGSIMTLDHSASFFFPKSLVERKDLIKRARASDLLHIVAEAEDQWIDLRAAYACTINKAQGSTYDRVYIDLDDISRCNMGDQIARMLYVGVSRARHQVFLTGDLI